MRLFKRSFPLVVSIALVFGVGYIAFYESGDAQRKASSIHRDDRAVLQHTLAGLGNQYVLFSLKDMLDFVETHELSLGRNDRRDVQMLRDFVSRSATVGHGAAVVGLDFSVISSWSQFPGLPPLSDPGYQPMITSLLKGEPGLSSVMKVDGTPVVALAIGVPPMTNGMPRALFIAYFNGRSNPLETYNQKLVYGRTGRSYMVDSTGGIIAASRLHEVGTRFAGEAVVDGLAAGTSGWSEYATDGTELVASYAPIGLGGWGAVTVQEADEFFGPLEAGERRVGYALLGLLIVAALALAILNHRREMALRKAYEYKGELLANTTHELKTPLTAIRGATMTLGMRWREMQPDQIDSFLGIILRRCEGLGKLVERILMGARLEAGREIQLSPQPLPAGELVRRLASDFRDASPHHQVVVIHDEDVWVEADPDAFDQVLGLLVENAIKYSPDGGDVRLSVRRSENLVEFRVEDQGIGISDSDMRHIFEPYFKASRGDVQRFAGVGLGLSIARHLVRRHGGDLTVSSRHGFGSTFAFTLPVTDPPERDREDQLMQVS